MEQTTFALYFGNRGFFPAESIAAARSEMERAVKEAGYGALLAPDDIGRYGAVETTAEGRKYAAFLEENRGKYDGVIICLPNFGDENGAMAAFTDCDVPILIQAYDDEAGRMDPAHRRDAFCGKFAIMDIFYQMDLPFTSYQPHTQNPLTPGFAEQLRKFAAVCRVVRGMRRFTVGAIGARTTPFKTVRFDELTLQRHDITTEAIDLSDVLFRINKLAATDDRIAAKRDIYAAMTDFSGVPDDKFTTIAKAGVILDELIGEFSLDALALRCWPEFQQQIGISPCVIVSELNSRGIIAACEMDVNNAVAMRALALASGEPPCVLDWNNNYGHEYDKCILFHCGPVPNELLKGRKGKVGRHSILENSYGEDNCIGVNAGRFDEFEFTYASAKSEDGAICFYTGEGEFTDDPVSKEFFGTHGVAKVESLQDVLEYVGKSGYKHHVSLTRGKCAAEIKEALENYLMFEVDQF